ncbi:Alpha/Beta hydrolase protein [Bisporella sp. PMI_857]|nr:Alpha/Beta hydrolase protein [Bisporella sp. PMI_857]
MTDTEGFAPAWLAFEKEIGMRPMLHGPIEKVGQQYAAIGAVLVKHLTFPTPDPSVKTEDRQITPELKVRIYTPTNYVGGKPVCVFYHSGGWALGDLDGEDGFLRRVAKDVGIVIVSTEYRLAPQNPYPAGFDDCVAAYRWALDNAISLNTTPNKAITFGTSAGGHLALATALKIIDAGQGSTLKGVVSLVPVTVARDSVPEHLKSKYTSYEEHAEHTIDTPAAMKAFADAYGGDGKDPYISPLLHTKIEELPKTYITWAGQDTLRDDGKLFKAALDETGVPNKSDEYTGYPHFHWSFPSKHLSEAISDFHSKLAHGFEFILL